MLSLIFVVFFFHNQKNDTTTYENTQTPSFLEWVFSYYLIVHGYTLLAGCRLSFCLLSEGMHMLKSIKTFDSYINWSIYQIIELGK